MTKSGHHVWTGENPECRTDSIPAFTSFPTTRCRTVTMETRPARHAKSKLLFGILTRSQYMLMTFLTLICVLSLPITVRCEVDIDECASSPCMNNGTCIDLIAGYECNCTANFTGINCQIDVSTGVVYQILFH